MLNDKVGAMLEVKAWTKVGLDAASQVLGSAAAAKACFCSKTLSLLQAKASSIFLPPLSLFLSLSLSLSLLLSLLLCVNVCFRILLLLQYTLRWRGREGGSEGGRELHLLIKYNYFLQAALQEAPDIVWQFDPPPPILYPSHLTVECLWKNFCCSSSVAFYMLLKFST